MPIFECRALIRPSHPQVLWPAFANRDDRYLQIDKPSENEKDVVVVGTLLGIVFGASSMYLVLKVGLTVSASIPVAVLSFALFRVLSGAFGLRKRSVLENNISQTAGSAGESIAFGVGLVMPALLVLGFDIDVVRVMVVGVFGALLGILMMIPLRRALIVKQHGVLKYPEGTACAEVLKAGASAESQAAADPAAVDRKMSGISARDSKLNGERV